MDVTISAGEGKIRAHKLVLAASSPYFRSMFTGSLSEVNQTEVTIRDIEKEALEALINFCYTSSIELEENNVESLLSASCYLQMVEIKMSLRINLVNQTKLLVMIKYTLSQK